MNKISLIIAREYFHRIRKKSFILLTLFMPLLMVALSAFPLSLSKIKSENKKVISIIDETGEYVSLFLNNSEYTFIIHEGGYHVEELQKAKHVYAFIVITEDLLDNPSSITLYSNKQVDMSLPQMIKGTIEHKLREQKIATYDIANLKTILKEINPKVELNIKKWDDKGHEKESSVFSSFIIAMALAFLIYMFVLMYSSMVLQGAMEEKTNRIVELMVSSVKPFQLMMGKIIGIGLVGITQILIWGTIIACLVIYVGIASASLTPSDSLTQLNSPETQLAMASLSGVDNIILKLQKEIDSINFGFIGLAFIFYFIGGYLLFAAIYAAIGSALNEPEDAAQFVIPITFIVVFALYAGIYSANNPTGPLAFWGSFIPFTSPIVMMVRLPYDVTLWEIALSLFILFATAFAIIWLASKIYRVGILMYGKKPTIKEMLKWVMYK